jgi:hypothetical protein
MDSSDVMNITIFHQQKIILFTITSERTTNLRRDVISDTVYIDVLIECLPFFPAIQFTTLFLLDSFLYDKFNLQFVLA